MTDSIRRICPDCGAPNAIEVDRCAECNHPLSPLAPVDVPGPAPAGAPAPGLGHAGRRPRPPRPDIGAGLSPAPGVHEEPGRVIPRRRHERVGLFGIGTRAEPVSDASAPSWLWVAVGTLALGIVVTAAIGISTQEPPFALPGGNPDQAQRADSLAQLLKRDSLNVRANVALGNLLYDTRNYGEAVAFYRRALSREPALVDTRVDLAVSLHQAGHTGEALAELERVLSEKPDHAVAHFDLGVIQEFMGRFDEAESSYHRASRLQIGPELRQALNERLNAVAEKKRAPARSDGLPPGHP